MGRTSLEPFCEACAPNKSTLGVMSEHDAGDAGQSNRSPLST